MSSHTGEREQTLWSFFFLAVVLHSLWDFSSPTRSLALRALSPNHWMPPGLFLYLV